MTAQEAHTAVSAVAAAKLQLDIPSASEGHGQGDCCDVSAVAAEPATPVTPADVKNKILYNLKGRHETLQLQCLMFTTRYCFISHLLLKR